jgi:hypothetical protein
LFELPRHDYRLSESFRYTRLKGESCLSLLSPVAVADAGSPVVADGSLYVVVEPIIKIIPKEHLRLHYSLPHQNLARKSSIWANTRFGKSDQSHPTHPRHPLRCLAEYQRGQASTSSRSDLQKRLRGSFRATTRSRGDVLKISRSDLVNSNWTTRDSMKQLNPFFSS